MLGRLRRWLRGEVGGERLLFITHSPEFQAPQWRVGEFIEHEGGVYVVTRWSQGSVVPLNRGGSVQQWEVWGRPVDPEDLAATVDQAAERILAEGRNPEQSPGDHTPGGH